LNVFGFGLKRTVFREMDFFVGFLRIGSILLHVVLSDFRWLSLDIYHLFDDLKLLIFRTSETYSINSLKASIFGRFC